MQQIGRYYDIEFESIVVNPRNSLSEVSILDLFEPGIHFLLGKNGSGKSRLIDSISAFSSTKRSAFRISVIGKLPSQEKLSDLRIAIEEFTPNMKDIRGEHSQKYRLTNPTFLSCVIDSFWEQSSVSQEPFTFFSGKEVLEYFGFSKEDIDKWEKYFRFHVAEKIDDGLDIDSKPAPNFKESFSLADHKCQIFLAWLKNSKINFKDSYHYPVHLTDSTRWIESQEKTQPVLEAFLEFIDSVTHVEFNCADGGEKPTRFFRLIAKPPIGGLVAQLIETGIKETQILHETVKSIDKDIRGDFEIETAVSFPFDLFNYEDFRKESFIASISIHLREDWIYTYGGFDSHKILEFFDPKQDLPAGIEDSLSDYLAKYHKLTTSDDVSATQDNFFLTGFEKTEQFLEILSKHLSKIQIGVSQIIAEKPRFKSYRFEEKTDFTLKPKLFLVDSESKEKFPFRQASSGQKDVIEVLFWLLTIKTENCLVAIATLDEFDKHLQSSAAEKLLFQINELSKEKNLVTIVSTHRVPQFSSSLIRQRPRIFAHKNKNNQPVFSISEKIPTDIAVDLLGVHANEALNLKKVRILVEGLHDAMVIKHLIETSAGINIDDIDIIYAIGTQPFPSLWRNRFTRDEIPLLIVHDKQNRDLESAFRKAKLLAKKGAEDKIWKESGLLSIDRELDKRMKNKKGEKSHKGDFELKSLMWLMKEVLGHKYTNFHSEHFNTCSDLKSLKKIEIFGLNCDDIVDLLPITAFPGAAQYKSWEIAHKNLAMSNGEDFKNRLGINETSIKLALTTIKDKWHPELIRLCETVSRYFDPSTCTSSN